MMYAFLNRPVYTQSIKSGKQKNKFSCILHQPNNCSVNPTCSVENDIKGFRLARFFLNEILQMSKFKFFVLRDKFSSSRFETQVPGAQVPGVRFQAPGFRCVGSKCQVPGTRCHALGVRCQVLGTRCQTPGVRCQIPDSRDQVS